MRLGLLAVLWLALTNGDPSGWGYGLVVVPLVWILSSRVFPPGAYRVKPLYLPQFTVWFLVQSLSAGWDVSRRLMAPQLAVAPGEREVPFTLPEGSPRWLAANLLSLMPGTLSVEVHGETLLLHCLDTGQDTIAAVAETERQVARLFGITPSATEGE
ncbi:Na+/H+ antiporter subunit E [Marinobacter sp.]|uniref:Na+/H+ antiporter subunit E n=1 Tax=Marinobacter sp. TaxID=50741 RepID=UPI003564FD0F